MTVETTAPIRCQFRVAISARVHREVLEQIASAQLVALATICPQAVVGVPPAIWIAVSETDALRMALARCPS